MKPTSELTLGPFFPLEFAQGASDLTLLEGRRAPGEPIEVIGRVTQSDGRPTDNLVLEIWQADAGGRYDNPAFLGWGRAATDAGGEYRFRTVMPGAFDDRAPHVNFLLVYSGLMRQLHTVMFFAPAPSDPVYLAVDPLHRERLVAKREKPGVWRFDLRLRGEGETPFFGD